MRLIDADALKKSWSMGDNCEDCPQDVRVCQYVQDFTRMDICEMLDEAPTVGGWISVKDRLPEDECECLVLNEGKWYWIGWFKADEQQWVIDGVICGDGFVTHWMPLSEPPEDENDGRNGTV